MEKEQILEQFSQGFDCSQVVLTHLNDKHSLTDEQTDQKVAACFGGGIILYYEHTRPLLGDI